jgi:CheY-like chemotaxis protein
VILKDIAQCIQVVTNGQEAVDAVENHSDIDLVLMDIKLPIMNGYEATRKIREINKDIVIIAQTAYAISGDREKAIAAGCDDYVSKPIVRKTLMDKLVKYL